MKETKNTTWNQKLYSISSLKGEIKYIFRDAKNNHKKHKEILNSLKLRVYDKQKYKTLPNYCKSEIKGYIEANFEVMYDHLEWVHWYKGSFVHKNPPYGKNFDNDLLTSEHVYIGTQDIY